MKVALIVTFGIFLFNLLAVTLNVSQASSHLLAYVLGILVMIISEQLFKKTSRELSRVNP